MDTSGFLPQVHEIVVAAVGDLGYGLALVRRDGRIAYANEQLAEMAGRSPDELAAVPHVADLFADEDRAALTGDIRACFEDSNGEPAHDVNVLVRPDGTRRTGETHLRLVETGDEPLVVVLLRGLVEPSISGLPADWLKQIFQNITLAIRVIRVDDPEDPASLRLVAANRTGRQLPGIPGRHGRRPLWELLPPRAAATLTEGYLHVARTGTPNDLGDLNVALEGMESPQVLAVHLFPLRGKYVGTFIEDVTDRARLERDHQRLITSLESGVAKLRATDEKRRMLLAALVTAQEEERKRIASDVHDDSIQIMVAVRMRLSILRERIDAPDITADVAQLEHLVVNSIDRLRRLIFDLRPPALDTQGLVAALRDYLAQWEKEPGNPAAALESSLVDEPDGHSRTILFRIAQEALVNVHKHAQARSVTVSLEPVADGLLLRVADDGVGFKAGDRVASGAGHLGLTAMRERAEMAGGWWRLRTQPGAGCRVEAWVPLSTGLDHA